MLLNKGEFKEIILLSPKTRDIMTIEPSKANLYSPGQGFGVGFGVTTDVAASKTLGPLDNTIGCGPTVPNFFI